MNDSMNEWMNKRINEWMNQEKSMGKYNKVGIFRETCLECSKMKAWMNEWIGEWMN